MVSPMNPIVVQLSWVHMVQHMLIMMIAVPLLVISGPVAVSLWPLPRRWRALAGRAFQRTRIINLSYRGICQPLLMWAPYAFTLWIWHFPLLYEAALHHTVIHDMRHVTFLVNACLFWRVLLDPIGQRRLNAGGGIVYLFTTSLHASAPSIFMTLSPRIWYAAYERTTPHWSLSPMTDQQLAGLIMWMPACLIYSGVVAIIFFHWIRRMPPAQATVNHERLSTA